MFHFWRISWIPVFYHLNCDSEVELYHYGLVYLLSDIIYNLWLFLFIWKYTQCSNCRLNINTQLCLNLWLFLFYFSQIYWYIIIFHQFNWPSSDLYVSKVWDLITEQILITLTIYYLRWIPHTYSLLVNLRLSFAMIKGLNVAHRLSMIWLRVLVFIIMYELFSVKYDLFPWIIKLGSKQFYIYKIIAV